MFAKLRQFLVVFAAVLASHATLILGNSSVAQAQITRNSCYAMSGGKISFFAMPIRSYWTYDLRQNPQALYQLIESEASRRGYSPFNCQLSETQGGDKQFTLDNSIKNPSYSLVVGWWSTRGSMGLAVISACDNTYKSRSGYCAGIPGDKYTLIENGEAWSNRWWQEATFNRPIYVRFQNPHNTGQFTSRDVIYSVGEQMMVD